MSRIAKNELDSRSDDADDVYDADWDDMTTMFPGGFGPPHDWFKKKLKGRGAIKCEISGGSPQLKSKNKVTSPAATLRLFTFFPASQF